MFRNHRTPFALALLITLLTPISALAQDSPWSVEVHATSFQLSGPFDLDDSTGLGLGLGYRGGERWGIHLDASRADADLVTLFEPGLVPIETSFRMTPITARLDFHLTPDSRVDFFVGPTLGWIRFGELRTTLRGPEGQLLIDERIDLDDQLAWGGHLGLDVDLGRRAYLTGSATFLQSDFGAAEFDDDEGRLDQWLVRAGLGVRF